MAVLEDEPNLPAIVHIQRYVRTYLRMTRLKRCVTAILKISKAVKVMQKFADRAPF